MTFLIVPRSSSGINCEHSKNLIDAIPDRQRSGDVMVSAGLVGLVLVAYLSLAKTQHSYNARTETWHSALPLAEAGVEEAMTHLNDTADTNLTDNGWSYSGGVYTRQRSIGGGFYGCGSRFPI